MEGGAEIVDVGGFSLRCLDRGSGEPSFVLVHPGGASLESWSAVLPALAATARVVAVDRPGWGGSGRPPLGLGGASASPYGPVGEAALLTELVERLGLARPILVGSSAGGTVALVAALARPERFAGLVLLSPGVYSGVGRGLAPGWLVPFMKSRLGRAMGPRMLGRGFARAFPSTLRQMFHDGSRVTAGFVAERARAIGLADLGATLWETAIAARRSDLPARLSACAVPALVVAGDDDRFVPVEENRRLAQALPRARLEIVPACGHLPQEEHPEVLARLALSFRVEIDGGGEPRARPDGAFPQITS
jgi:pimeloyl-ACP methyl ester carboxylesterase